MDPSSYFSVVSEVSDTWESVRRVKNYDVTVGKLLFKKMFELLPAENWGMFPFAHHHRAGDNDFFEEKSFVEHATKLVRMLDLAIQLLGPEMELVEETLLDVGARHYQYGVQPKHFPLMGIALIHALQTILGKSFTIKSKEAWTTIYTFLSTTMVQGTYEYLSKKRDLRNEKLG